MASTTTTKKSTKPTKTTKTSKVIKNTKADEQIQEVDDNPSIFIPSVFANIDQDRVTDAFNSILGEECVDRVDFVIPKNYNGNVKWKMCFVHFTHWPNNKIANKLKAKIQGGGEQRLVYDDPYFWKILLNKKKPNTTIPKGTRPKIVFDDDEPDDDDEE